MKCLWCEIKTTPNKKLATDTLKYANKEHIFPESVGGINTLEIGMVCQDCNKRLGDEVDRFLKTENFMMLKQYQDSSMILGKPIGKARNKKDKERKQREIFELKGYSGGFRIKRDDHNSNNITLTNLPDGSNGDFKYNTKFSKALHKCAINVLLNTKDYDYMKENYNDLIDFVNNPKNDSYNDWSYAVCYSSMFSEIHFEPFCLQKIEIKNIIHAVVLIFPCAIFIVCTKPNIVDLELLEIVGLKPPELENWKNSGFDYLNHFKQSMGNSRKTFGKKLKFTLLKNKIMGIPNPKDSFYLLNKCNVCGQINPTGILLKKENILGKINGLSSGDNNGWNYHSDEDLDILFPGIDLNNSSIRKTITNYGINYPIENDVKKLDIKDSKYQCINCKEKNSFNAIDCFI